MASRDFGSLEQLGAAVMVVDRAGSIVFWNSACSELIRRALDTARGRPIWELVALPGDPGELLHELHGKRSRAFQCARNLETGEVRLGSVGCDGRVELIVLDELGEARANERKRFEDALRVSEERLSVALRASPAVVFNQDPQLRYTWIHNPKDPFHVDQVLGRTDFDLLLTEEAEQLAMLKRSVLESASGVRKIMRTTIAGDELYFDLTIEPLHDHTGTVVGITGAAWDVTEQRRIEHEQRFLAEAGSILAGSTPDYEQTLSELAGVAVRELADWCLIDVVEAGEVRRVKVACSDPARSMVAAELENTPIERRRPHLMFAPIEHRRATLVTDVSPAYVESVAQSAEYRRLLRALDMRSLMAVPLVARDRLLGALALISSRDSRKYRERDLRFAEEFARIAAVAVDNAQLYRSRQRAIAARDQILGVVAHDLRNPLNMMLLQSEVLRARADQSAGIEKSAESIRRAALRMTRLIEDMLDLARVDAGALSVERVALSTRALLDEVMETQRAAATKLDLQVRLEADDLVPDVLADRGRLLQVFDNLIGNALKFTSSGGDIVIGAATGAGEALFWVKDTGPGIAAEHLPHLFDRFWQATKTDRRGAGLGLAIVHGIVAAHGGRIWVESQLQRGTTFFFTIPVASVSER
jgi:signal transduction histidine kinase/PAS domain-containing protein